MAASPGPGPRAFGHRRTYAPSACTLFPDSDPERQSNRSSLPSRLAGRQRHPPTRFGATLAELADRSCPRAYPRARRRIRFDLPTPAERSPAERADSVPEPVANYRWPRMGAGSRSERSDCSSAAPRVSVFGSSCSPLRSRKQTARTSCERIAPLALDGPHPGIPTIWNSRTARLQAAAHERGKTDHPRDMARRDDFPRFHSSPARLLAANLRNPPSGFAILPSDGLYVKPNRNHFTTVLSEINCPNRRARRGLRRHQSLVILPRTHDPRNRPPIALAARSGSGYLLAAVGGLRLRGAG